MQSGKIKKHQLSSYAADTAKSLNKARLYGSSGWRPNDAYLDTVTLVLAATLEQIMALPIFFEIRFERMKKISYFLIQDSVEGSDYTQSFYIVFNDTQLKLYKETFTQVRSKLYMQKILS